MIIGANGAGKSTILKIILGFVYPTSGKVIKGDLRIGYVPEKIIVPPFVSVYSFLKAMMELKEGTKEKLDYYLQYFKLDDAKDKKLKELSKGMLQKAIIIQAFLGDPDVLIFDEALNGLDIAMQKKLLDLINKEKKKNKIILITSHYKDYYKDVVSKTLEIESGLLWEN